MASNGQTVTRDELIDLLNDRSAPVEKYRNLLSEKESGQLILPTGFESVIQQLEEKYKDTVDDNDCLVDIQTLKVYDGQDLNQIQPISSGDEEEIEHSLEELGHSLEGSGLERRPISNVELLASSLESDSSDIERVSFVPGHGAVQYQQLFLEKYSESEVSNEENHKDQRLENGKSEKQDSESINSDTSEYQRFENQARWSFDTSLFNSLFPSPDGSDSEPESKLIQSNRFEAPEPDQHADHKDKEAQQEAQNQEAKKMGSNSVGNRDRQSWPSTSRSVQSAYTAPQYHKAPVSTLVSYEAPSSSKLYDGIFQSRCLQTLKQHLMTKSRLGTEIRSDLESKIMKTIGMNAIPNPGSISIFPFIHFDDSGEYHISILFDCPPFSPWSAYTRNLFGSDFLRLQKEVYDLIRTNPGMNVFGTHALVPSTPIQSIGMASSSDHNRDPGQSHRKPFGRSSGQKCSPIRSKTKVTSKKQKVTSPNRRTVIEMVQKEYYNVAAGDLSTSDLSSTTGSEYAPEQRLYLQSMYNKRAPVRRMLELNGRGKKSGARSVSEKKVQDAKPKGQGRKSLPALPMPNFRDFELGASALNRPSSTSTPSTRTSNGRITSSSRPMSPEIGFSDDALSSLSAPSTNGSNGAPVLAGKKLPVKKIAAQSLLASISASNEKTSKVAPGGSKSNSTSTKVAPSGSKSNSSSTKVAPNGSKASAKRSSGEVSEKMVSKKRKSDPKAKVSTPTVEDTSSSKEPTSKTPASGSSKTMASSSKKITERMASSMTAAHVMSTPIITRPDSRSDVPITADDPTSPNSALTRVLRPRKSLMSPKKLVD